MTIISAWAKVENSAIAVPSGITTVAKPIAVMNTEPIVARVALWVISGFIIGSILLVALYRYVPPPGTPLMLLRRVEGYGIYKSCVRPDLREPGSCRNRERGYSILQSPRFRLERDHDGLESLSE
jgi:hypothetical protein